MADRDHPEDPDTLFFCADATHVPVTVGSHPVELVPADAGSVSVELRASDTSALMDVAHEITKRFRTTQQERHRDGNGLTVLPMWIDPSQRAPK
ncbi:hypothetical protein ACFW6S_35510 [Streptomyces sp. NPDC058740]|uniref:hypothetical protein n=1 Tax=Streptomyces sp. NPDC058740 TaxID=3346619 RepID=UPI0036ABE494